MSAALLLTRVLAQTTPTTLGGGAAGGGAGAGGGAAGGAAQSLPKLALPAVQYHALIPELVMIGGALVLLALASVVRKRLRPWVASVYTVAVGLAAMITAIPLWREVVGHGHVKAHPFTAVDGALAVDGFSVFFVFVISSAVVLGALVSEAWLRREEIEGPEFHVLMMLSAAGGMFMAAANDLIVIFLGLEVLSIALYVLAGFNVRRMASREAAIKYFVLGAFSSALFLYGIALVYGSTGTTNLAGIASFLATNVITSSGVLLAGMVLLIVGLGFKVAAVPFHTWTPDVYQGAPTPATGFMAAAAKAAGFAGLLRILMSAMSVERLNWQPVIWGLAVLTLLVGSVVALVQTDIKRMLAYSSISHAGYVLIGLQAGTSRGVAGSLYYLLTYTFMILGSFAIVTLVGRRGDGGNTIDSYKGLSRRRPTLALAFTILLLAQAGIPFTTGFLAKFYVIAAAIDNPGAGGVAIAIIGMVAAVIAAFFYLRVVVNMYMAPEGDELHAAVPLPASAVVALTLALAFTIVFGLVPSPVIHLATKATLLF